jgi:hypothetical protein
MNLYGSRLDLLGRELCHHPPPCPVPTYSKTGLNICARALRVQEFL